MKRLTSLLIAALMVAGCASAPQLPPWRSDPLLSALPASCAGEQAANPGSLIIPGGLSVVQSAGREVIVVAARSCVMTVDAATGAAEPLPTRGDSIAPTMVHAVSNGVAFSSSLSGSVRAIDTAGAVTYNVSSLQSPLGVRLMPGGSMLVAEYGSGRILRVGPGEESRMRVVAEGLDGPVDLVVTDAKEGYVTESGAGRLTRFDLDRFETQVVARGLDHPEGIALLADGRLAVAEAGARRLVAIDPKTGKTEMLADNLPIGLPSPSGGSDPYTITGVAAAPEGAVYVSSDVDRTILRLTVRK